MKRYRKESAAGIKPGQAWRQYRLMIQDIDTGKIHEARIVRDPNSPSSKGTMFYLVKEGVYRRTGRFRIVNVFDSTKRTKPDYPPRRPAAYGKP